MQAEMSRQPPFPLLRFLIAGLGTVLGGCPSASQEVEPPASQEAQPIASREVQPSASVEATKWHDCARDDAPVRCTAEHPPKGLIVHWADGQTHRLTCVEPCEPNGLYRDENGDEWRHELFIQGNSRYTHLRTEESIFIPLRPSRE